MKKVHFIAIGGSAMHNLAIALHRKGYEVTGSDDEIFEPSRTRLKNEGILPEELGWHPEKLDELEQLGKNWQYELEISTAKYILLHKEHFLPHEPTK